MARKTDSQAWQVKVIRSRRRKRTISAEVRDGVLVVRAPAEISEAELALHIESLQKRLAKRAARLQAPRSDAELTAMAERINRKYFDGALTWQSIRYVSNMQRRYGSCTPGKGTIRISDRLLNMPKWVLEYVLVHELAHLVEANHGKRFWALVNRYPRAERARGYLMAVGMESETGEGDL